MAGLAGRALSRVGRDVDVINYTKTGEDDYGENYSKDAPITTKARVVPGGDVNTLRTALSTEADVDAAIYVEDSTTITRTGGGEHATRIDIDQDGTAEYTVIHSHDQGNGLLRLDCRRRTEG